MMDEYELEKRIIEASNEAYPKPVSRCDSSNDKEYIRMLEIQVTELCKNRKELSDRIKNA